MTLPGIGDAEHAPPRPEGSGLPVGDLLTSEPITCDLSTPAVVLAVGAHPDDIEFGGGATLAKWAGGGARLHYLVLTDGSKGTWDPSVDPSELVEARMEECRAAAAVVDGPSGTRPPGPDRIRFLGRIDGELQNGTEERRALVELIRRVRPTVIVGHDPWRRYRLHPDHRAAGEITVDAVVAARDHLFFPDIGPAPHRPDALLLFEADAPNHLESVRGFEAVKTEALLSHRSQFESTMGIALDGTKGDDRTKEDPAEGDPAQFAVKVRRQLAQHGALGGLPAAEAFRLIVEL